MYHYDIKNSNFIAPVGLILNIMYVDDDEREYLKSIASLHKKHKVSHLSTLDINAFRKGIHASTGLLFPEYPLRDNISPWDAILPEKFRHNSFK